MPRIVFKLPRNKSPMTFKLSRDKKMHFVKVRGYKKLSWPEEMLASYLERNSHATLSIDARTELLLRLQPGEYLHTTFGPGGQDKVVCDFLKLFEFDANLVDRSVGKTGDLFRWDVDNTVYFQNSWPVHTIDPAKPNVVTLSTTDSWVGLSLFYMHGQHLTNAFPTFADCSNLQSMYSGDNAFVGNLPSFEGTDLYYFWCNSCFMTGLPASFSACGNLHTLGLNQNNFAGALPAMAGCPLTTLYADRNSIAIYVSEPIQVTRTLHDVHDNILDQASVDNVLIDYEVIKTPMALSGNNYTIRLEGGTNAAPSAVGIAAKNAIIAEFVGTPGSGVLTILHN